MKQFVSVLSVLGLFGFLSCDSSTSNKTCGDGVIDVGEECDTLSFDGNSCSSEGYHSGELLCTDNCTLDLSGCVEGGRCGDGQVQTQFEECDGDNMGGATCGSLDLGGGSLSCTERCSFDTSACEQGGVCGNDVVDGIEHCDGDDMGGDSCETLGWHGGTLVCDADCRFDLAQCETYGRCGDAEIQSVYEECEGTDLAGGSCEGLGYYGGTLYCSECAYDVSDCAVVGRCQDGVMQPDHGETCDGTDFDGATCLSLGYYGGELACSTDCVVDLTSCEEAGYCGDDILHSGDGEECDSAQFGGVTCASLYRWKGLPGCDTNCGIVPEGCDGAVGISVGNQDTYLLDKEGVAWSFGSNQSGKLGDGGTDNSSIPVMVSMPAGRTFIKLDAGESHVCALDQTGDIYCWGYNFAGALGIGTTQDQDTPVKVTFASSVPGAMIDITGGNLFSCGLSGSGEAWCWGKGDYGQIGDGAEENRLRAVAVSMPAGTQFTEIHAGQNFTCALSTTGIPWCWGRGVLNVIGTGSSGHSSVPVEITLPAGVTFSSMDVGYYHVCGITTAGQLYCWGSGYAGKLGLGNENDVATPTLVPVPVSAGEIIVQVEAGNSHTCALGSSGNAWCWGDGSQYRLGTGNTTSQLSPAAVSMPAGRTFVRIASKYFHGCGVDQYENVWCWGDGMYGQCGDGAFTDNQDPTLIAAP